MYGSVVGIDNYYEVKHNLALPLKFNSEIEGFLKCDNLFQQQKKYN